MKLISKALPQPIFDRVLVRALEPDAVSRGGVIIPQSARQSQDKPTRGTVVATGPGSAMVAMSVKVDDEILFFDRAAIEIDVDGETLYLIPEAEILLKY